jgi:LysM repeat protein
LFEYEITDYKSWAKGLKKAGYATNPKYPELLIRLIEKYDLAQYDTGVKSKRHKDKTTEEVVETTVVVSPLLSNNEVIYTTLEGRDVYENYGVRYIIGKPGDTFYTLAEEFDIYSWQLFKYNDREKDHVVKSGEIIYLEKKNKKADKKYKTHIVKRGETLHYISDLYCIRIKSLVKMNNLEDANKLSVGQKLKLR